MTKIDVDKAKNILPDLVEKHFPKGECQERSSAILLSAIDKVTKILENYPDIYRG